MPMRIITLISKNIAFLFFCLAIFAGMDVRAQCPTVANAAQSFCDINSPTVANLVAFNNGGGVVWYANATGGSPLSNATGLVNGEDYFADSVAGCGSRQLVTVTIYSAPTGLNFQGVCVDIASNATISDLQAVGNNVRWYGLSSGGAPLAPTTVLIDNTIYYASQTNPDTGCETSRLSVFVNVGVVPVPTGSPTQEFCLTPGVTPTVADLNATGNNNWYLTETSAAPLAPETPLINGQSYFATTVDPPCESIDRFEVAVSLVPPSNAGVSGARSICINNIPTTAPFNLFGLLGGAPNTNGTWSGPLPTSNGHLGTVNVSTLTVAGSPYVFNYNVATGVCAPASSTVTINVLPMPTATLSGNATICSGNNATVTFTGTPNATITYTTNPGGTQIITLNASGTAALTTVYTTSTTITLVSAASATTPSCVQPLSGSVTVIVLPLPTAAITANTTVCSGGSATVTFTGTPNATVTYIANPGGTQTITLNASGTATISGNYTTTTTYTLVSVVSAGLPACTRPLNGSVTVTVLPIPTVVIASNATICAGQSATVTFTGTPNATVTYTTTPGGTQTVVLNGSGSATVTNTYNSTTVFALVSITTAGTPSCTRSVSGTVTITVLPPPAASIAANTTVCSGSNATVTFTGTPNATITYTANPGGTQTITLNASGTATLTNTYTTTTTYTLVSVASSGTPSCITPLNASITITIIPPPVVVISSNATVCPNGSATVTFTGTPNATVTYTANPGGTQTIVLNASGTATITANYAVTTTYSLISIATSGTPTCAQPASGTVTITVLPLPTVAIAGNTSVCSGGTATVIFTGTPNAVVTYTANPGGTQTITLNASGTATISNAYTVTTTYTLVSVASAGTPSCSQPASGSVAITVVPPPTASISANATVCSGQPATVTFTGTPNATITYTTNPGGTQTITLNASGTATITNIYTVTTVFNMVSLTSSGTPSCTAAASGTITITVIPPPTVAISSNATVCPNGSATITFTGTPNATVTYTASPGGTQTIVLNASGTAAITNTYTTTTTYSLVSIATAGAPGCTQPVSGSITITVAPLPVAAISSDATVCPGASATINFTGTPNATITYSVNPGGTQTISLDASGNASLTGTYATTTVYTLISVAMSGTPSCSQPASGAVTITVSPLPTVAISSDTIVCSGQSATVTFTGTPNAVIIYNVNPGGNQTIVLNAAGIATISNTYTSTTVYTLISATSPGTPGCSQPQTGTVTITVVPPPTVSINSNQSVCPNGSATIAFTGTPNTTVTYNASPGGTQSIVIGSSGTALLTNTYNTTTVYTLLSITTNAAPACNQPVTGSVTITVVPLPTATIGIGTTICAGSAATINLTGTPNATVNYTATPGGSGSTMLNDAGVGTITANYTTTTVIALTNVSVAGTPPCSQALNQSAVITVVQPPVAGNNAAFSICETGNSQDLFLLLGSAAQSGGTWFPALSSGTGIFNPAIDMPGTYTYTLTGTPPCPNATASVVVTIAPPADAGTNGSANLCSNEDPVDLFAFLGGNPQTGGVWTPALTSGTGVFDPGVDTAGVYTYTIAGTPPCASDSATVSISITPGPNAGISGNAVFCQDSPAQDLFLSLGGTPQPGGTWSPALASGTGVFDPAVDTPGIYTYTFEGNQPCDDDTATVDVTINPVPDAGQNGTAFFCTNYPAADLFTFLGGAPQPGGVWSPPLASGTGLFDPLVDPAGVYTYTVGGGLCAIDTSTVTVSVSPSPNAGGAGATLLINACSTDTAIDLFTGLNGAQGVGTWSDDDATAALAGNIFNAAQVGAGTYHFTYTVGGGVSPCLTDAATVTVIVSAVPSAGAFTGLQSFCNATGTLDLFSLITGYQGGGDWIDSNNLVVSNNLDISTLPSGTYSFTYQLTTACGTDSEIVQFVIVPTPALTNNSVVVSTPVCVGSAAGITISGLADGNYVLTYNLSGSNPQPDDVITVIVSGGTGSFLIAAADIPNPGTTTITFLNIGNTATNCVTSLSDVAINFEVAPPVDIENANLTVATICVGSDAVVAVSSASGLPNGTYQFNYDIPGATPVSGTASVVIANGSGTFNVPGAAFSTAGTYTITITAILTASGCNNLSENASASFVVYPIPDASGATVAAGNQCIGFDTPVQINGAMNLANGIYTIGYSLAGANISTQSTQVTFTGGAASFDIPTAILQNPGNTILTITQLITGTTSCGNSGATFNAVTFEIIQVGTPVLEPQGDQFCEADNPTLSDLSANIAGSDPVLWYDAPTGGNVLDEAGTLVNGATYYASHGTPATCQSLTRLEVIVDLSQCPEQDDILIPDGFSPNSDGINDAFTIRNLRTFYPNFKLEIYNRYGNLLYTGNNYVPDWDGTATEGGIKMGGNQVPVGVYFYILEFNDGIRKAIQGRVYLSR